MAVKEIITMLDNKSPCFNLTFAVGPHRPNHPGDVTLIQAFIKFIAEGFNGKGQTGLKSRADIPKMSGVLDTVTLNAINTFQKRWSHNLLQSDGIVEPAKYAGRNIQTGGRGPFLTITMLHLLASESAVHDNEPDYTKEMRRVFLELTPMVDRIWVDFSNAELGISGG